MEVRASEACYGRHASPRDADFHPAWTSDDGWAQRGSASGGSKPCMHGKNLRAARARSNPRADNAAPRVGA
eukprot:6188503-Pleurochrysis_carterae.AAC.5